MRGIASNPRAKSNLFIILEHLWRGKSLRRLFLKKSSSLSEFPRRALRRRRSRHSGSQRVAGCSVSELAPSAAAPAAVANLERNPLASPQRLSGSKASAAASDSGFGRRFV